jgi:hypothetical protein
VLQTNISDEEPCCGPKPVLFARDPEAVAAILKGHPEKIHAGNLQIKKICTKEMEILIKKFPIFA